MRQDNFRPFTLDEFPSFSETEDGERFLSHLNEVLEPVISALQRKLTPIENMNAAEMTLDVEHDVAYEVVPDVRGKVKKVEIVQSDLYDYQPSVAWEHVGAAMVRLKVAWDSAPTVPVQVTLRFEGGG